MLIDCDRCPVRGVACSGCLVSALVETPRHEVALTPAEQRAIEVFGRAGFEVTVLADPTPAPTRLNPRTRTRGRRRVA